MLSRAPTTSQGECPFETAARVQRTVGATGAGPARWKRSCAAGPACEIRPAVAGKHRSIGRAAGVDTGDNWLDFELMADPTPGAPNDRTSKAAVELYGEVQ